MRCLQGLIGLLSSRNGCLAIIVLLVATVLCWFHRIEGNAYAAVVATIATIYTFTRARYQPAPFQPFQFPPPPNVFGDPPP